MTEKCNVVRDAIAVDGRAPDNDDFREHLNECSECARFLKSVVAVEEELTRLTAEDVNNDTVETLLARPELSAPTRPRRSLHWAMGLAAAAMIAFVAARVTLMRQADFAREPEIADLRSSGRYEGDEVGAVVGGEAERVDSLASTADDNFEESRERSDLQRRYSGATSRDQLDRRVEELDDEEVLSARVRQLNEGGYFRGGEDADVSPLETKNEAPKKDSAAGSGVGTVAEAKDLENLDPQPVNRAAVGGRLNTPDAPASFEKENLLTETGVVTTESPRIQAKRGDSPVELDKLQAATDGFKSKVMEQDQVGSFYQRVPEPRKLVHVDAVYPEASKRERVTGTVSLRALIDRGGNVTRAIVVDSVEGLDQAAVDAVLQWKYEASDNDERSVSVRILFETPSAPNEDARLFLDERERVDGLHFRDARGYWANTYLPGDPKARFLAMRLGNARQTLAPHLAARPVVQPFDAPYRSALSLTLQADHRGVSEPTRMLVQVGIQATESHGRRRPPMNVGIVLDAKPSELAAARALIESIQQTKALGDRFRLILPGRGEVVTPDRFRHGPLTVALDELETGGDLAEAVQLAMEHVHAGDDPTMPLGSSLVLVVTPRKLEGELETLTRLAHQSAVGGVPVSVIGIGNDIDRSELERFALAGQGRRYFLEQPADATSIVDRELAASSRVVARALRLRIKLAAGVELVDVIGSRSLSERQAERVRVAEKSIDLRLSRNLGIEADRGDDEDGIQMVIPSFYAGDAHTILLDVVATRPGAIAEVTARYKDLAELENTVAKASLSLPRSDELPGPLETNVVKNYLAFRLSEELEATADELDTGDRAAAISRLERARDLLTGLDFGGDREIARDLSMLNQYIGAMSSSMEPAFIAYIADSLRFAGASKKRLPAGLT